jgi:hypothetical protein
MDQRPVFQMPALRRAAHQPLDPRTMRRGFENGRDEDYDDAGEV